MSTFRSFLLCLAFGFLASSADGQVTVWELGTADDSNGEFSLEADSNGPPGNPLEKDDDYYFAGFFDDTVGEVVEDEPLENFDRALADADPTNRIHFILEEFPDDSVFRLTVDTQDNDGVHPFSASVNDSTVIDTVVRANGQIFVGLFKADDIDISLGENVVTLFKEDSETAGGGWINFDYVALDALDDTDNDGLPDMWEMEQFPGDLTQLSGDGDFDSDGLSDSGEFSRFTDPRSPDTDDDGLEDGVETDTGSFVNENDTGTAATVADTDGDGLSDGDEVSGNSSPLTADTDGDGLDDGDEVNGDPPTDPSLADTDGDGNSDFDERGDGTDPTDPEDFLPWLLVWEVGTDNETQEEFSLESGAGNDPPGSPSELDDDYYLAGFYDEFGDLPEDEDPFNMERAVVAADPDVRIHFILEEDPEDLDRFRLTVDTVLNNGVRPFMASVNDAEILSGEVANADTLFLKVFTAGAVNLQEGENTVGLHTSDSGGGWIQFDYILLERTAPAGDQDFDGLPDDYEESFFPGDLTQLSGDGDFDSDGLTDLGEFQSETNPTVADTDEDGLEDGVETKTGVFVDANDTGTDPLNMDSDEDTIPDGAEVNGDPATNPTLDDTDGDLLKDNDELAGIPPTNPALADTDGDGFDDRAELLGASDPDRLRKPAARLC